MKKLAEKNVLIISYYFPPVKAVGTLRNINVANQLSRFVKNIFVFSTSNKNVYEKENIKINKSFKVSYLPTFDYQTLKKSFSNNKKKTGGQPSSSVSFFVKLLDSFPFNILIGEGGFFYIMFGFFKGIRIIKNVDIIYSSFRPYSDHVIAYLLKLIKPSIIWIADFRDIHVEPEGQNVLSPKLQERINKFFFKKADLFTVVSAGYINGLKQYHSSPYLLRNGFSDIIINKFDKVKVKKQDKFSIIHAGGLYGGRRNPELLMQAVSELIKEDLLNKNDIELGYAGKEGDLWCSFGDRYGILELCENYGFISLDESLSLQKNATINFMITWTNKLGGTFPAKFYEYLAADRPILLLINGDTDKEFESIYEELTPGVLVYNNDKELVKLKEYLRITYQVWKSKGYVDSPILKNKLDKYHWNRLGVQLAEVINEKL